MKHFRKCWDAEKNEFIKTTKNMGRDHALQIFRKRFPDTDITDTAFFNQRSRLGAANRSTARKYSRATRPLYSEQEKKGYIRIKVAQPSVWISKARWVYEETHPWEDYSEKSNYIFLDGNTRNFSPENIERIPIKLMGIFCNLGGSVEGAPELTRLNILRAKLKVAQLDALEKTGNVKHYGSGRVDKEHYNKLRREYIEKNKERIAERRREHYQAHREEMNRKNREYRARRRAQGGEK